jgi:hypothetical protein
MILSMQIQFLHLSQDKQTVASDAASSFIQISFIVLPFDPSSFRFL